MARHVFYKRSKRGALNAAEKSLGDSIEALCKTHNIDPNTLGQATNLEELGDIKSVLEAQINSSPPVKKPTESAKESAENTQKNTPAKKERPAQVKPDESLKEPVVKKTTDSTPAPDVSQSSATEKFNMGDFIPQENSNAFAAKFKTADRDYAVHNEFDQSLPNAPQKPLTETEKPTAPTTSKTTTSDITETTETTSTIPAATEPAATQVNDSTRNPWEIDTDQAQVVEEAPTTTDPNLTSDDPEKVALAEATKKKATKHIAKQAATFYAFLCEKGGNWAGRISENRLAKMEANGLIDRNFILDEDQKQTVEDFVDDHNKKLKELVVLDEDVKDDFQEALQLVMEKHQFEVTPEVNLAIVTISGIATVVKTAMDIKKDSIKILNKTSRTYTLVQNQLAEAQAEIARLKAQNANNAPAQPSIVPKNTAPANTTGEPEIPKATFVKTEPAKQRGSETVTSTQEEITSDIEGEEENRRRLNVKTTTTDKKTP